MTETRRGFLAALAGAASAMVLDPERLLWRPGARLISIPRPSPVYVSYRLDYCQLWIEMRESWSVFDSRAGALHFCNFFYPDERVFHGGAEIPSSVRAELGARLGVDPDRLQIAPVLKDARVA